MTFIIEIFVIILFGGFLIVLVAFICYAIFRALLPTAKFCMRIVKDWGSSRMEERRIWKLRERSRGILSKRTGDSYETEGYPGNERLMSE